MLVNYSVKLDALTSKYSTSS